MNQDKDSEVLRSTGEVDGVCGPLPFIKTLFGLLLLHMLSACESTSSSNLITEKMLEEIQIGTANKVNELLKMTADSVCVLSPYQDGVSSSYVESKKINDHLRAMEYKGYEGQWGLVVVNGDAVSLSTFKRTSVDLDTVALSIKADGLPPGPDGFLISDCAQFSEATLFKFKFGNDVYIAFGRSK